ncbi:MAG: UDP-2,4-diacetamido-2,4,6-trideoxy-beta-L-altropyranose hydrolase [Kiloniellaceae bacterium]
MRAIFRADASSDLGSGHIMRCLTLADSLSGLGWNCGFAVAPGSTDAAPALARAGYETCTLDGGGGGGGDGETESLRRHWPDGTDWLVVDHYARDRGFETACRPWAARIMVVDDLADRPHDCDILLDQALNRAPAAYSGLVPPGCRLLLGTRYALLRPEFAGLRTAALQRPRGQTAPLRLLVSLGGTDPDNVTALALDGIERSGLALDGTPDSAPENTVTVDVVVGAGCPWREEIAARVAAMPGVRLHVGPNDLAAMMAQADLAIGAAGTSSWERCCLGLPTVMLVLADNQLENARQLSAARAVRLVDGAAGDLADAIAAALHDLDADREALQDLSTQAAALCDGLGARRTRLSLLPPQPTKDGRGVTLRLAGTHDEATLLHWQQQPAIRNLARNPRIPTPAEHRRWFAERLHADDCFITMIEHGDAVAGMLRLDRVKDSEAPEAFEVSIVVDEAHRGAGVGLGALKQIRAWLPEVAFHAETLPRNTVSISLFRTAGYTQVAEHLLHCPPARQAAQQTTHQTGERLRKMS